MSTTLTTSKTAGPSDRLKIDGELVVWTGERLDFGALQRRMVNSAATIRRQLAPKQPASYVAFDLLAVDQVDIRMMRLTDRQRRLTSLANGWRPPLQLSPITDNPDEAREWLNAFSYSGDHLRSKRVRAQRIRPSAPVTLPTPVVRNQSSV